jgi:hypothetical protein
MPRAANVSQKNNIQKGKFLVMDKKSVYIETSIISYLTARPSSDLLAAAWQKVTIDWWDTQRDRFDLFASEIVIEEAGKGELMGVYENG